MSIQQNKFKEIADCIRSLSGWTMKLKPSKFADTISELHEAALMQGHENGLHAERQIFWNAYQQNGGRTNYAYAFYQNGWTDETYHAIHPIQASGACGYMYAYSAITNTLVPITVIHKTSTALFRDSAIQTIPSLTVSSECVFTNWFHNCSELTNITFTEESVIGNNINFSFSPKLTKNSLLNIINTLADKSDDTSGEDFVCSFGTENLNKLTATEIAIATEKGWSLV